MKKMIGKDGGVLVMVMVVMLAFAILAIGLLRLHDTDALETVYVKHTAQAFWVAEAGLQRTLGKLRADKAYRNDIIDYYDSSSPFTETNSVGNGGYSADVWYNSTTTNFVIQSLGTVHQASRKLSLNAVLSDIGDFTLIGTGGTLRMDGQGTSGPDVDGNVYQDGAVEISTTENMDGTIFSTSEGHESIAEDEKIEIGIYSDYYNQFFSNTAPSPPSDELIDLKGYTDNTLSVNASVDSVTNLVGAGTLVVNGTQDFGHNVTIESNINIYIDGNLYFGKSATLGDNVHIYVRGNMVLKKEPGTVFGTGEGCSILVEGNLGIKKSLVFQGLIIAGGKITASKDLTVSGTMVAGNGFDLEKDAKANFNAGVIPDGVLDNAVISTFFVQSSIWNELPVN